MAVDSAGNVYVADNYNHTIRKVTPDGVVTTLAGALGQAGTVDGTGCGARFSYPRGVAVDRAGNVYVADSYNHTIRKVTPAAVVTTLAGAARQPGAVDGAGAAARFNNPINLAVDGVGNVYVADNWNHTIRKVTPAGVVTTLAGAAGQPGAADGTGAAARFRSPNGVGVDGSGNVYVADRGNSAIRKITLAGDVTTVIGTLSNASAGIFPGPLPGSLVWPRGLAFDAARGAVYIAVEDAILAAHFPVSIAGGSGGVLIAEAGVGVSLSASGGQGPYVWTIVVNESGGSITADGVYTAGVNGGTDTLMVTDATGATATIVVRSLATTYVGQRAVDWLSSQMNADGSWGASRDLEYLETTEAALALASWQRRGPAYQAALSWLENHRPANIDYRSRRIMALHPTGGSIVADVSYLRTAQSVNASFPGNGGVGLTEAYQGAPLDTALVLQAYQRAGVAADVAVPMAFLKAAQLGNGAGGWAAGQESTSDPVTTAHVVMALIPYRDADASLNERIANGLAALGVTAASSSVEIALVTLANLRHDPVSPRTASLRRSLIAAQASDGSWGGNVYATALALRTLAEITARTASSALELVSIPDPILRDAINRALGRNSLDALTRGEMAQLTTLDIAGLGVTDLTGLEFALNLLFLDARYNNIISFAPIEGLTQATVLR